MLQEHSYNITFLPLSLYNQITGEKRWQHNHNLVTSGIINLLDNPVH